MTRNCNLSLIPILCFFTSCGFQEVQYEAPLPKKEVSVKKVEKRSPSPNPSLEGPVRESKSSTSEDSALPELPTVDYEKEIPAAEMGDTPSVQFPAFLKETISNVEMKIFVPKNYNKKRGVRLALFLHGDTANGYFENYFESLKNYSLQKDYLFVAALSPNRNSWWHKNSFADDLDAALSSLETKLNFSKTNILFSGVSGGSTFLTMQFIPKVGESYGGTVAATCGGAPSNLFQNNSLAIAKKYKIHFTYGDQDFLADPFGTYGDVIPQAIRQYQNIGFQTRTTVLPQTAHCDFDVNREIIKIWESAGSSNRID